MLCDPSATAVWAGWLLVVGDVEGWCILTFIQRCCGRGGLLPGLFPPPLGKRFRGRRPALFAMVILWQIGLANLKPKFFIFVFFAFHFFVKFRGGRRGRSLYCAYPWLM
jgi:hypothetical protein